MKGLYNERAVSECFAMDRVGRISPTKGGLEDSHDSKLNDCLSPTRLVTVCYFLGLMNLAYKNPVDRYRAAERHRKLLLCFTLKVEEE